MNLPIHLILAAAAEPAADAASSQPKQPIVENLMQDTRSTLEQIHEQGPGFFANLWEQHSDDVIRFVRVVILALVVIVAAKLISMAMKRIISRSMKRFEAMDESLIHVTYTIVRTIIWIIGVLIILDLFGFNTASILTVLGAAGLAIGLAMKDSLSNIAAGIMLIILRPYRQGDFIDCGSISGSIEQMGLFSTTLKTPDGLFVSAPNSVVFGTPIKNYSRNPTRRSDITVGVAYSDSLPVALQAMQELLNAEPLVLKDPAPEVLVSELADSSVQLTLRYWTKTGDYWDAFWSVKSKLKPQIENAGLNIPFPQRVVTFVNGPKSLE
jgi:small conductance mechanosensitive channel